LRVADPLLSGDAVVSGRDASVIVTMKVYFPGLRGVPVTAPVLPFRLRPGGNAVALVKLYGFFPPVTARMAW